MKTILIAILAALSVALVGVLVYQKLNKPAASQPIINQPSVNQEQQSPSVNNPELKLTDYPMLFQKDVMIVARGDENEMESEAIRLIVEKLNELTGNKPLVKKLAEVSEKDKTSYNLILMGIAGSPAIFQEIYGSTKATKITKEYPGIEKGLLEILKSPWNKDRTLLLVEGSDQRGVDVGMAELYALTLSELNIQKSKGKEIAVKGIIKQQVTQWTPQFNECTTACYFIEDESGKQYYLANICPYLLIAPDQKLTENKAILGDQGQISFINQQVEVRGKFEQREVSVPGEKSLNASTEKESFEQSFDVALIRDLAY